MGIKIGIISDIHFGKLSRTEELIVPGESMQDNSSGQAPLLGGAVDILKEHSIKYLFIAGDLTSIAGPQEYYYCQNKILELAESVGINPDNIIYCTGNHDVDWKIAKLSMDYSNVKEEVQEYVNHEYQRIAATSSQIILDKIPQVNNGVVPISGVIEKDELIVFVLNSSLYCTPDQEIPHGKLGAGQLEWLSRTLKEYTTDEREKIILMHHHPIHYPYPVPEWDISSIEESSEFLEVIAQNDISLVIHGHRHQPIVKTSIESNWIHEISFLCAGSFSVNADHRLKGEIPNTFHIVELGEARGKYILYNYEYFSSNGWQPVRENRKEIPMDDKMRIGKIPKSKEVNELIKKYKVKNNRITWDSLDKDLQYLSYKELNEKFREIMGPEFEVFDEFPNKIVILEADQ